MKHTLLALTLFCFSITHIFAQAPSIQWQKTYGGSDGYDQAQSVIPTYDGGYIVAGSTTSDNGQVTGVSFTNPGTAISDIWVTKLSSSGGLQWEKAIGAIGLSSSATAIIQTTDSDYVVEGYYNDYTTNFAFLAKIDHNTDTIKWRKSYGTESSNCAANAIKATSNGGLIVVGYADSTYASGAGSISRGGLDYLVMLLDDTGGVQWQKTYGGANNDIANAVQQTSDGGFIVSGSSISTDGDVTGHHGTAIYNGQDYWVVKLSPTGTIQWQKSLGGTEQDISTAIQQTSDGGYIVGGYSASTDGDVTGLHPGPGNNPDNWLVKLDAIGTVQWEKTYGGTFNEMAYSTQQTTDGGYMMGGSTNSINGDVTPVHGTNNDFDYWIMKTDASGTLLWQKTLGGSLTDEALAAVQTPDGGYMIVGNGNSRDGDLTGDSAGGFWVVKLSGPNGINDISSSETIKAYPNPTKNVLIIESVETTAGAYRLTDLTGRVILEGVRRGQKTNIDLSTLSQGSYILHVDGAAVSSFKVVKD